jgi:hypothetical protein
LMGVVLTADGVAEALAPMLVGNLHDRTTSYAIGFFVLIGLALMGATAIALLPQLGAQGRWQGQQAGGKGRRQKAGGRGQGQKAVGRRQKAVGSRQGQKAVGRRQ